MKKSLFALSFSLIASLSRAEDDGFYMSVGYQIGEAVQKVKNTGALQNLADRYDNLNNLLNQYNYLNSLVNLASTPSAITGAIGNLSSSAINLTSATTTSPAYQAVALALNAAVGMWQVIALFLLAVALALPIIKAINRLVTHQPLMGQPPLAIERMGQAPMAFYPLTNTKNSTKLIRSSKPL
ncbi:putative outer membrane protein 30 1 [Helicobacter pylori Hp A-11]|uniref:Putative outer membrane protein 30 1 n=1 Tax=Helicobacter pylori Hp A-11 TaxID=992035 RepID=N4TBC8_HELPX|nr:putative outer membrane protein 30 1 [Helicobacter pylori Hp A-11]